MCRTAMRGAIALPGSKTTSRWEGSRRNLRDLASGRAVPVPRRSAPGRRGAEAGDERGREVGPRHSSDEAAERGRATGGGGGGAKGGDRGERGAAKHIPDAEPEACDPGAEPRTASRKAKEAGAVHRAAPPRQYRYAPAGVLRAQARGRRRRGRYDMAGLRGGARAEARGSRRPGPPGGIRAATVASGVHPEGGWAATTPTGQARG